MQPPFTLSFDDFWTWLTGHPNCILRMGTPEVVLYDDEHLHWHFATYEESTLVVQLLHGKRAMAEIFIDPEHVTYVQGMLGESDEEYVFELVSETETDRLAAYFFVLSHGYEDGDGSAAPSDPVH